MYLGSGTGNEEAFAVYASGASGNDQAIGFLGPQQFGNQFFPYRAILQNPWYQP
jgi:hypothetical protein